MKKITFLIPAFNPVGLFPSIVKELSQKADSPIIVVNDGSLEKYNEVFEEIGNIESVYLLSHENNLGKGRALKTGLKYISETFSNCIGIITMDSDGQHSPDDALKLEEVLYSNTKKLVLGAREITRRTPLRSRIGNQATNFIFNFLTQNNITDTQTGLRGIPVHLTPSLLKLPGNRYEFELEMLLLCCKMDIAIKEVPIQTIYLEKNKSSHFNPLTDSYRIYKVLFKYLARF